ncbi:MAG TPA: DUF3570 domain-containing protein [Kofleriaceae bacterium]|nr:DUF3570 domain-containing protein [Kofleriaceae bacterium]
MRLQLIAVVLVVAAGTAYADGTLSMRGVYYKERSTRVVQPMLDAMFEVGAHGLASGHLAVDAITSASPSSGAEAEAFTEQRYEGGAGYAHEVEGPDDSWIDVVRVGGEAKVSKEPDYRSIYAGARLEAELAQKNATLGLGGGVSLDEINNTGAQSPMGGPKLLCDNKLTMATETTCPLNTYSVFTSASQLVDKNALIGVSYDLAKAHGFTSNAYRQVITTSGYVPEKHPNDRLRQAVAISGRYYWPRAKTAFIAAYRFYWDDWKIHAHTPELRIIQEVGTTVDASFRYRYYKQNAAFFYEKPYPDQSVQMSQYLTDDPKMTAFDGHLMEAKLGILGETFGLNGRWAGARIEGILEYIVQNNRFGNAVVAHASLTVPFDY